MPLPRTILLLIFLCGSMVVYSQNHMPTRQDTLKGSNTPEKAWWDVLHYSISIIPDYHNKTISGSTLITYRYNRHYRNDVMQVDLQPPLHIDSVYQHQKTLSFSQDGSAWFIKILPATHSVDDILVYYSGMPKESTNSPWDGGLVWRKDSLDRPWLSVACQDVGASIWYPCKTNLDDEPDNGASLTVTVPDSLFVVGNGHLRKKIQNDNGTASYTWSVINPINSYGVSFYAGNYVNEKEIYHGAKGPLEVNYWVMDYNKDKIEYLETELHKALRCFEYWFGPYPFYKDGFQLVEAPYVGMEHQSAVAYGNAFHWGRIKFKNLSYWDFKTDRLIVHETAHEWFGNNITSKDPADNWIHEGFAGYAEELFIEQQYGKTASKEFFLARTTNKIESKQPMIPGYGIFETASSDAYLKGWAMIHMLRSVIDNDSVFKKVLHGLNRHFYHKTVTTAEVEKYMSKASKRDLTKIFDQYLRSAQIPVLEYKSSGNYFEYRFTNCNKDFSLPLRIDRQHRTWITPTTRWQKIKRLYGENALLVAPDFYVKTKQVQ